MPVAETKQTAETQLPPIFAFSRIRNLYDKVGPESTSTGALHSYELDNGYAVYMRPKKSQYVQQLLTEQKFDSSNQPVYLIDINVKERNVLHLEIGTSGLLKVAYGSLGLIPNEQVRYVPAAAYREHRVEYSITEDIISRYMKDEYFKNKVYPFVGWLEHCIETRQFENPPYPFDLSKKIT